MFNITPKIGSAARLEVGDEVGQIPQVGADGKLSTKVVPSQAAAVETTSGPRIGNGGHGMQDSSTVAGAAIPNFEAQLDAMVARGMDVYRMDISWMQWMPVTKGTVDAGYKNRFDNCLRELKERNFKKVILTAIETPEWARPAHLGDANKFWRPVLMQDYADFWTYWCTAYKTDARLFVLEIWNEPSNSAFWQSINPSVNPTDAAIEYAEMLVKSYTAIKAVSPLFEVGGGVLHRAHDVYLQKMFDARSAAGAWDVRYKFDYLSVHLYVSTVGSGAEGPYSRQNDRSHAFKPGLDLMQEKLIANGIGTQTAPFPIIVTEWGWSDATINAANGDSPAHNEATTANRDTWTRQGLDILFSRPYRDYVKFAALYTVALHPGIEGETLFNGSYASPLAVFDSYAEQLATNGGSGSGGNVTQPDPPESVAVTVANSVAETTIYENVIPAGRLKARRAIKVTMTGVYGTTGTGPLCTIRVKLNGVTVITRATTSAAVTATSMFTEILMTIRAVGAAGLVQHVLRGMWNRNATDLAPAQVSVNTTGPLTITVTAQWSVAAAANTITIDQAMTEIIGGN